MNVGDLVIWREGPGRPSASTYGIGIVTHLWEGGFADILFSFGELCVRTRDYEVIDHTHQLYTPLNVCQ